MNILFLKLMFALTLFSSCKTEKTLTGSEKVNGLNGVEIEFHQSEKFMGTSDIWYNLKTDSTLLLENKFLFHTSDNLNSKDFYTNSYDSIIYVSFNNSKDDVLYFIDLKNELSSNTELKIDKDSIPIAKYQFLQDSLFEAKDSIFRILNKHNYNLNMTGFNKSENE